MTGELRNTRASRAVNAAADWLYKVEPAWLGPLLLFLASWVVIAGPIVALVLLVRYLI
jgi:hypothetical protein